VREVAAQSELPASLHAAQTAQCQHHAAPAKREHRGTVAVRVCVFEGGVKTHLPSKREGALDE